MMEDLKLTIQERNINYYLNSKQNACKEVYKDRIFITFMSNIRGEMKPQMMVWKGKQKDFYSNYIYSSLERREEVINKMKDNADSQEAYKLKRKEERKAFKPDLNVGDIYYSSWGYEQTNVDFYQVVEIKGKSTVVIRAIASERVGNYGHDSCNVIAVKDSFLTGSQEKTLTKRVGQNGIYLTSFSSAWKWNGEEKYTSWGY